MATYKFLSNSNTHSFPVANVFIDKYLPVANATFVKVYLYGLRHCFSHHNQLQHKEIAAALNILESDVVNGWLYWESVGVVRLIRTDKDHPSEFDVEFIDLSASSPIKNEASTRIALETRPNYTAEEISIYIEQDENIRYMYTIAQQKLGKLLSSNDINILYSFYDWLRLPIEVIIMLLEYCVSLNKRNMRYIEKVALSWADLGINSIEKAEKYLKEMEYKRSLFYEIKKCLGIVDRSVSDSESKYITEWITCLNTNIELVKLAYDLTVLNTGKLSFPYLNSILVDWHERGIKTVDAAQHDSKLHKENNKDKYAKPVNTKSQNKNNKFINFSQRTYDFKELERLALQKSLNSLKKAGADNGV